jgi:hypothetical protein
MNPNTHGGTRRGAGRPPKPGWKLCGFRLEVDAFLAVKRTARQREISQSELVNELLKRTLPKA